VSASAPIEPAPPHPLDQRWYVHQQGKTLGPYTGHEIKRAIEQKQILGSDLVYRESGSAWVPAKDDDVVAKLFQEARDAKELSDIPGVTSYQVQDDRSVIAEMAEGDKRHFATWKNFWRATHPGFAGTRVSFEPVKVILVLAAIGAIWFMNNGRIEVQTRPRPTLETKFGRPHQRKSCTSPRRTFLTPMNATKSRRTFG
jgi:hypothetical protein